VLRIERILELADPGVAQVGALVGLASSR
jgi:hypothetical protein